MCRASCNAALTGLKFRSAAATGFSANVIQFFLGGGFVDPLKALCEAFFKLEFKRDVLPSCQIGLTPEPGLGTAEVYHSSYAPHSTPGVVPIWYGQGCSVNATGA
jgi:hypothetical protein